ncbi:MAG: two-component system sensor histidine kinase CreC [Steroidobacter sp.]
MYPHSLAVRIFLVHLLFVLLSGYFVLRIVMGEIKPGVRQSTEETLVDTANLLAEILHDDVKNGTLAQSRFPELLRAYGQRHPNADIWGIEKTAVNHRIYVTDRHGIVLLDSANKAVGEDYSKWNDVYLTLHGQYGARSTQAIPGDEYSTVMYVAAPIMDGKQVIGTVTVAKPNRTMQPYIDRTRRRLAWFGGGIIVAGIIAGALLAIWLSVSIRRLTFYAKAVSAGHRVEVPKSPSMELTQLANALESMRVQLEGKAYVERYVQTLTHELKSPLSAIHGATEVLRQELPDDQRQRFLDNIDAETIRLQQLSERLLNLAQVEQRQHLEDAVNLSIGELLEKVLAIHAARIKAKELKLDMRFDEAILVLGERFLLQQALINLLDNALDFVPKGGALRLWTELKDDKVHIHFWNQGDAIPDFALPRLTERFYSLPRPGTGRKSTGLGLNFVREVAELHGGSIAITNTVNGIEAELMLGNGSLATH